MARSPAEFLFAKHMQLQGYGDRAVSRRTAIPYGTLRYWRSLNRLPRTISVHQQEALDAWRPPDAMAYAHLLGLYLGDGCLGTPGPLSVQLTIILDARYPSIVAQAEEAMRRTMPRAHVGRCPAPGA